MQTPLVRRHPAWPTALLLALVLPACRERAVPASMDTAGTRPEVPVTASVDSLVARRPGESLSILARRLIPPGAMEVFAPREFAGAGHDSSVAILFRDSTSQSNYIGLVLSPSSASPSLYRRSNLPAMDEAPGLFEITVRALLAAGTPSALVVQYEYYRTGSGQSPDTTNIVYHLRPGAVAVDTAATAAVRGIRATTEIRARLEARASSRPTADADRPR